MHKKGQEHSNVYKARTLRSTRDKDTQLHTRQEQSNCTRDKDAQLHKRQEQSNCKRDKNTQLHTRQEQSNAYKTSAYAYHAGHIIQDGRVSYTFQR
eukprot:1142986-Pelagomonas_calceolata.AAC.3